VPKQFWSLYEIAFVHVYDELVTAILRKEIFIRSVETCVVHRVEFEFEVALPTSNAVEDQIV
jgi:hypothetical protein